MTEEIKQLDDEIQALKKANRMALGIVLQILFHTSALFTAGLTLLGGIAGLYSTVRYGLGQERKQSK